MVRAGGRKEDARPSGQPPAPWEEGASEAQTQARAPPAMFQGRDSCDRPQGWGGLFPPSSRESLGVYKGALRRLLVIAFQLSGSEALRNSLLRNRKAPGVPANPGLQEKQGHPRPVAPGLSLPTTTRCVPSVDVSRAATARSKARRKGSLGQDGVPGALGGPEASHARGGVSKVGCAGRQGLCQLSGRVARGKGVVVGPAGDGMGSGSTGWSPIPTPGR